MTYLNEIKLSISDENMSPIPIYGGNGTENFNDGLSGTGFLEMNEVFK
jgi:hypothetical protein